MQTKKHVHKVKHWPRTTDGYGTAVCECGATRRVVRGTPVGSWHACSRCTVSA